MNRKLRNSIIGFSLVASITVGVPLAANAAYVVTSMNGWNAGDVGYWRTDTGVSQEIQLWNCSEPYIPSTPDSVQLQLQRNNGLVPISEGNKTNACNGPTFNWGTQVAGAQYRYQLNGYTVGGAWKSDRFYAYEVDIWY